MPGMAEEGLLWTRTPQKHVSICESHLPPLGDGVLVWSEVVTAGAKLIKVNSAIILQAGPTSCAFHGLLGLSSGSRESLNTSPCTATSSDSPPGLGCGRASVAAAPASGPSRLAVALASSGPSGFR